MKKDSKYYHGKEKKGCLNVVKEKQKMGAKHYLFVYTCLTHGVETCHCGWEFGKHYEK
ncbi:MAG: hypothetical protein NUV97_02900 [archaeon]|nr:hypothetical protein [archaeon]MCR4343840.1 hypothetical protein [Candidatus Scalindua sp.]